MDLGFKKDLNLFIKTIYTIQLDLAPKNILHLKKILENEGNVFQY